MTETPAPAHFKVDMPQIPGVGGPAGRPPKRNPLLPLVIAFLVLGLIVLVAVRWFSHNKPAEPISVESAPQIDVPPPPPDPRASLPVASESDPVIASVAEMAKPWTSIEFLVKNKLSGENIPAVLIGYQEDRLHRLPGIGHFRVRLLMVRASLNSSAIWTNCGASTIIARPIIHWSAIPAATRCMIR